MNESVSILSNGNMTHTCTRILKDRRLLYPTTGQALSGHGCDLHLTTCLKMNLWLHVTMPKLLVLTLMSLGIYHTIEILLISHIYIYNIIRGGTPSASPMNTQLTGQANSMTEVPPIHMGTPPWPADNGLTPVLLHTKCEDISVHKAIQTCTSPQRGGICYRGLYQRAHAPQRGCICNRGLY